MASPQLERGYTKIANEILENVAKLPLTAREYKILLVLFRFSYGYKKKYAKLSLRFLEEATKIESSNICKVLNKMQKKKIITRYQKDSVVVFNKDYEQWEL